jgi:hypothetical protein
MVVGAGVGLGSGVLLGLGLSLGLGFGGAFKKFIMNFEVLYEFLANSFK